MRFLAVKTLWQSQRLKKLSIGNTQEQETVKTEKLKVKTRLKIVGRRMFDSGCPTVAHNS